MRTAMLLIMSLSVFLATTTRAIRLIEEKSISASAEKTSEVHMMMAQEKLSLKEDGSRDASKEIQFGSHGHCSGSFRKLISSKMSTSKMKRSNHAGGADNAQSNKQHNKEESSSNHEDRHAAPSPLLPPVAKQTHLDILYTVGMDYSYAKKKSPIHN